MSIYGVCGKCDQFQPRGFLCNRAGKSVVDTFDWWKKTCPFDSDTPHCTGDTCPIPGLAAPAPAPTKPREVLEGSEYAKVLLMIEEEKDRISALYETDAGDPFLLGRLAALEKIFSEISAKIGKTTPSKRPSFDIKCREHFDAEDIQASIMKEAYER